MLSIDEIKNISFRRASFGGYRPEDVDTFIDQVLVTMEQLRKEKSDLIKKMDILATRVEEYRSDEDAVRNAMLSAQRVADSTIKEAKIKSAKILEESENIAKAKLYDLNVQIKQQKKQYTLLLAEYNRIREDIINHCNKHIALLREMPSEDRIKSMEKAVDEKFPTSKEETVERASEVASANKPVSRPQIEEENTAPSIDVEQVSAETAAVPVISIAADDEGTYDVNLINDLDENDVIPYQKRSKDFTKLKFGDDYDVKHDNGNADSDNT
ncbi:MAG: DivIVA domain-containing protein [Ruminococcus sp.]|nr:DivIVA domain-containing protein [Ruminococcus sp.]